MPQAARSRGRNRQKLPQWKAAAVGLCTHRGQTIQAASVTSTRAKNEFGQMLDRVIQGDVVVITKHDHPKAVMLSFAEYRALTGGDVNLDSLRAEFDARFAMMQTPKARAGMDALFKATPEQLGRAAVTAARKRG